MLKSTQVISGNIRKSVKDVEEIFAGVSFSIITFLLNMVCDNLINLNCLQLICERKEKKVKYIFDFFFKFDFRVTNNFLLMVIVPR